MACFHACAVAVPQCSKAVVKQWTSLGQSLLKFENDSLFVKKIISLLVSHIFYERRLFPPEAFGIFPLEGKEILDFNNENIIPDVLNFTECLGSAFEALDSGYLKQIRILIYSDDCGDHKVVNEIRFKIVQNKKGFITKREPDDYLEDLYGIPKVTREQIMSLLKNVSILCNLLISIPRSGSIKMILLYDNEITPLKYEPPGYYHYDMSTYPDMTERSIKVRVGCILTPYHMVKVYIRGETENTGEEKNEEVVQNQSASAVEESSAAANNKASVNSRKINYQY